MDDPGGQPFGLAPITLADKPFFDRAFGNLAQPTTDYSFANSFIWSSSLKLYWASIASHLCLFANGTGDLTLLLPPVPEVGAGEELLRDCLGRCFAIMDEYNDRHADRSRSRIEYVSDELLERLGTVRGMTLSASPMSGDYVYDMARMIDLAGGALKSKRHARTKFIRDYPDWRTEPLAEAHVPACFDLLRLWRHHGDTAHDGEVNDVHVGSDILRHKDTLAAELALTHRGALGLRGMSLFVGGRLIGFTLGEAISRAQASIIVEKTHPDFPGSAQIIFSEFCRQYWSEYPECNAGDDWGIPSLRFTKQSYRPMRILNKYLITRHAPVIVGGFPAFDLPSAPPRQEIASPGEAMTVRETARAHESLRPATLEDLGAILAIERACFAGNDEGFNRRQLKHLLTSPRATVTVAEDHTDGGVRVVGWAAGLVRQHRRCRSGRLYAIAVRPEARGRQLARSLVETTLEALALLNIEKIFLEVRADNEPALGLYRRLGFVEHCRLDHYYGQGEHGTRMKMIVNDPAERGLFGMIETAMQTAKYV